MVQTGLNTILDKVPASAAGVEEKNASQTGDTDPVIAPQDKPVSDTFTKRTSPKIPEPPSYFGEALLDAERLLKYAAEFGIDIDDDVRSAVLRARTVYRVGWTEEIADRLLAALTTLAARLRPVTAESLKAYHDDIRPTVRFYWRVTLWLAIIIVPFSLASFVTSAISKAIRTDIITANGLAVKLRAQLGPPADAGSSATHARPTDITDTDVITELQELASTIRAIDARGRELNLLVIPREPVPFAPIRGNPDQMHKKFELPAGLPNFGAAAEERVEVYQDVRYFAQSLLDNVSVFYGAITTCVLPVLYALLGTCGYLLRTFEQQMGNRTFTPSAAYSARFLIAAIGGAVVGLFNNFSVTEQASIPPLAIAFLVGYAVDVFFAFLEGLLQAFTKKNNASLQSAAPVSGEKPSGD